MFIGHFAAALAAGSSRRAPGLGTLILGSQLVDVGFFALVLAGIEKMRFEPGATAMNPMDLYYMPYTHSLPGSLLWALGFAIVVGLGMRSRAAGVIAGAVVFSHWLLDLLVHRPDLGLWWDTHKVGLGLWNVPMIEMPLEILLVASGAWLYVRRRPEARLRMLGFVALLLVLQAIDWFGPKAGTVDWTVPALALFAYGLATAAAVWVGRAGRTRPRGGSS